MNGVYANNMVTSGVLPRLMLPREDFEGKIVWKQEFILWLREKLSVKI